MVQELDDLAVIRKVVILKNKRKFFHTAVADIFRCIDGQAIVAPFSQTLCLIDQMAWVEFGKVRNSFNMWMEKRMTTLSIYYGHTIEELYLIRCGLIHSFGPPADKSGIYKGYLLSPYDGLHLQRLNSPVLRVNLYNLVTDTVYATHRTFEDLAENCSDEQMQRLDSQIGLPSMTVPHTYAEMHRALACFDNPGEITITDIRADYTREILYYEAK
jgi:hypothetical protein